MTRGTILSVERKPEMETRRQAKPGCGLQSVAVVQKVELWSPRRDQKARCLGALQQGSVRRQSFVGEKPVLENCNPVWGGRPELGGKVRSSGAKSRGERFASGAAWRNIPVKPDGTLSAAQINMQAPQFVSRNIGRKPAQHKSAPQREVPWQTPPPAPACLRSHPFSARTK